jgi:predicted phage tail protein
LGDVPKAFILVLTTSIIRQSPSSGVFWFSGVCSSCSSHFLISIGASLIFEELVKEGRITRLTTSTGKEMITLKSR